MSNIGIVEIVHYIADSTGISDVKARMAYNELVQRFSNAIQLGHEINLFGLATISVVERKARVGRNPQTGEPVQVPAKKALKIKLRQAGKTALGQ